MDFNFLAIFVASLSTLVLGFVWYHEKLFGRAWMKAAGMTEDKMKSGNMALIFGLAIFFGFFIAFAMYPITVHQLGAYSMVGGNVDAALPSYQAFMEDYGEVYRTFKHGAFHGLFVGLLLVFPIISTNALFERKSVKYVLINSGFWILSLIIMGGIICAWK